MCGNTYFDTICVHPLKKVRTVCSKCVQLLRFHIKQYLFCFGFDIYRFYSNPTKRVGIGFLVGFVAVKMGVKQYVFLSARGTFHLYNFRCIKPFELKLFENFLVKQTFHSVEIRSTVFCSITDANIFSVKVVIRYLVCRFFLGTNNNVFISDKVSSATLANDVAFDLSTLFLVTERIFSIYFGFSMFNPL